MGVEALQGPVGSRLGVSVPLDVHFSPFIEVLDVLGRTHYPLYRLAVGCQAVAISSGDAAVLVCADNVNS